MILIFFLWYNIICSIWGENKKGKKVGKLIKELRQKHHLTQADLANKYGVTYQAVSKWENGINLPDIALLKEISRDFNIDIADILEGEITSKKRQRNTYIISFVAIIIIGLLVIILLRNNSNFSFKTISTNCKEFKVTGSIAYDRKKSSINISNIDYCGGDDKTTYDNIECELYEEENNVKNLISKCSKSGTNQKLEDYLKEVEVRVDDYQQKCSSYLHNSLYLEIRASIENKTTIYKVDLNLDNNCPSKEE